MIHGDKRFSVFYGYNSSLNGQYVMPELRITYHDLFDSSAGYPVNSAIEMLKLSGSAYRNNRDHISFIPCEITLFRITSLNNYSFYNKKPSWSVYMGALRYFDKRCDPDRGTLVPEISGSLGLSKIFLSHGMTSHISSILLSLMIDLHAGYSSKFEKNGFSTGIGPSILIKYTITANLITGGSFGYVYYRNRIQDINFSSTLRYQFMKDIAFDLGIKGSPANSYTDYYLGLMKYW